MQLQQQQHQHTNTNNSHRRGNSSGNFKFESDSGKTKFVYSQEYDSDPLIQAHPVLLPQVEESKKILEFALLNDLDYNLNRKESETKFYETQQQTRINLVEITV